MKRAGKQLGFTIVETLIVLAATGLLFVIAAVAVNGEQSQTEFHQAINDIQSEILQTVDQVAAGDYQNTNNFTCSVSGGTLNIGGPPKAGQGQGSNTGCIFLGKAMQFDVQNNPQEYIVYPIAGLQNNSGGSLATANAAPTAIAPASIPGTLNNGLTVVSMTGGGNKVGAVAFISSLGDFSKGKLLSGSQQIDLFPVDGSTLKATAKTTESVIDKNLAGSPQDPSGGVQICFASGTTDQSGLITIGSDSSNVAVSLQIENGRSC